MAGYSILNKDDGNLKVIEIKIAKARKAFGIKAFKLSLGFYNSIEQKDMLNNLDRAIIVFCEQHCVRDCNENPFVRHEQKIVVQSPPLVFKRNARK